MKARRLASVAIACVILGAQAQTTQVLELSTRSGVRPRALQITPAAAPTRATLVLLMGGNGQLGIYPNGSLQRDTHLLARMRDAFSARGHAVVLVDVPSDRRELGSDFRESAEHAADLGAVIAQVRKTFGRPVWLVGHSRGTHSAVNAAARLAGEQAPDGIVLAASILESSSFGSSTAKPLQASGVEALKLPVLVLHHVQDACPVSPAARLPELQARLPAATSRLIRYEGGSAQGALCDVRAFHSFPGLEERLADDIAAWIAERG